MNSLFGTAENVLNVPMELPSNPKICNAIIAPKDLKSTQKLTNVSPLWDIDFISTLILLVYHYYLSKSIKLFNKNNIFILFHKLLSRKLPIRFLRIYRYLSSDEISELKKP